VYKLVQPLIQTGSSLLSNITDSAPIFHVILRLSYRAPGYKVEMPLVLWMAPTKTFGNVRRYAQCGPAQLTCQAKILLPRKDLYIAYPCCEKTGKDWEMD